MQGLERGFVQIYTGEGKGKTTAAVGLAVRALGAGLRVHFIQFLKTGASSENQVLAALGPHLTLRAFGRPGFLAGASSGKGAPGADSPGAEDMRLAAAGLDEARRALRQHTCDVLILDEIIVALDLGLIPLDAVLALVATRPPAVELVLTGRGAPPQLLAAADLVTEMRAVRHYYAAAGVAARHGIEM